MKIASILEDKRLGNCSNGGISKYHKAVYVTDDPEAPTDYRGLPVVKINFSYSGYKSARPLLGEDGKLGPMAGGSFILLDREVIPLHDRFETQAEYDALSY